MEISESGSVGRTNIDDKKIAERIQRFKREKIIGGRFFERGHFRFSEIDGHGEFVVIDPQMAEPVGESFGALVRKAHPIDKRFLLGAAEDAGAGVAWLGMAGDGAEFDESEPEISPCRHSDAVFVHTGGESDWVAEGEVPELDGLRNFRWFGAENAGERSFSETPQGGVVNGLGVELKEKMAEGRIHELLADTKRLKETVENIFVGIQPDDLAKGLLGDAEGSRGEFWRKTLRQFLQGLAKTGPSPLEDFFLTSIDCHKMFAAGVGQPKERGEFGFKFRQALAGDGGEREAGTGNEVGEIDFSPANDSRNVGGESIGGQRGWRRGPVLNPEKKVGLAGGGFGSGDPKLLDQIGGLAEPGGIDQRERDAREEKARINRVPSCPRHRTNNRPVFFNQSVEQARFTGVRFSGENDRDAMAEEATFPGGAEDLITRSNQGFDAVLKAETDLRGNVFVRKINVGFEVCQVVEELILKRCDCFCQAA